MAASILDTTDVDYVKVDPDWQPELLVVVDTEEEFDWSRPLARENTSVETIKVQDRAQEIFARYDHDFYKIDLLLFSPAEVVFHNLSSGRSYHFGKRETEILARSFSSSQ